MKTPPIHCWREPIDASVFAVVARCYYVQRSRIYGLSVFLILDNTQDARWNWREHGAARLREVLKKDHGGYMPMADDVREARAYGLA